MLPAWSLVERWKSAVARYANRPAVDAVCYAELDSLANAVARRVLERSADPARPVGFRLPHDVSAVATALGILKAGRAYCAVDRTVPREVDLVLTEGPRQGAEEPELPPPNGACAVFTTSGSQGQARTVVRSQEAMLRRLDAYDQSVQPGPGDVMNLCYRLCFGASAVDLFGALCSGAALALHRLDLESLPAWLHRAGVSVFHLPAEAFRPWLDRGGSYPRLRRVIPSGRLYWSDLARLWPLVGADCQVISQYSCTETSTVALWNIDRRTPAGDGVVPVGHPLLAEFELHDEQGRPVAPGEVGEIVVRGYRTGDLARYDGILHLVGRRDNRVKIRGHRVELEAVDDALQQLPEVEASVTVAHEGRLVSYFVSRQDPPPAPEHLRNRLDLAVPPALLIPLKKLPRLENGKVDRQALPAPRPFLSKPSAGPTDPLQARLAHLWAEALGLDQVGVEDDFLELGGDSLAAARLLTRVQSEFSTTLPWSRLLGGSTVAAMANVLREPPDDSGTTVAPAPSPKPATPRRILLRFVRRGPVGLPYPPGFALLNLWVLLPPVRRRFLRKKIEVFRRWLDITGLEGPGRALHQHLVANTWTLWRLESLKTAAARRTWVRARGLEHLDRGTVVVWTHTALRREPVLPFLGPDVYSLLGVRDATGSLAENVLMAERLKTARTTLERGGVVLIAGDGTMGRARFRMPFYDRHLDFRGGFAELALETGAAVVPAFSRLAAGGATTVDFLPALTPSTADGLVEQFARLYVSWWPRILPFLYSNHLETLLKGWQEARSPGRKHRG